MRNIIKRDGSKEEFNSIKTYEAIRKAMLEVGSSSSPIMINDSVLEHLPLDDLTVEEVQDLIEEHLLRAGETEAARAFIHYRDTRTRIREGKSDLFKQFDLIVGKDSSDVEFKRENANINADAPMGVMLKFGSESAKEYNLKNLIRPEIAELHRNGDIHIHDLDFYHTFNCVLPGTKVILQRGGKEQQVTLGDEFRLLGRGTHEIKDTKILSRNGFVDLTHVHIRPHDDMVYEFSTKHRMLTCTGDHLLPVIHNGEEMLMLASGITQNEKLLVSHNRSSWEDPEREDDGSIIQIRKYKYTGKVFDVTTGDHYFIANNIVSHNCCQIPLGKLLERGFSTGHGCIRQPNGILSAASVACIILQSNQNDMYGGQSFPMWDYDLAPYVAKSFIKHCQNVASIVGEFLGDSFEKNCLDYYNKNRTLIDAQDFLVSTGLSDNVYRHALKLTTDETHQAMQAAIHNLNTLNSRSGAQVPFSSINYGTDTSPEGRLIIKATLDETSKGLGHGETPIFPVQVFKCKKGVNLNKGSPNYDLFKLACEVTAKRLFPNFSFLDSPYNKMYYKGGHPETEMAVMGCRTRVLGNVYDPDNAITPGRGNFAFCTINLPALAVRSEGNLAKFFGLYDEMIDDCIQQLEDRFEWISRKHTYNFPFLMGQGVYLGSDGLGEGDVVAEVLKHSSLSVGFVGLAECLVSLIGSHHGQTREAQELGLNIVKHLRNRMDMKSESSGLNWTCFATPAEGLCSRAAKLNRKRFGLIPGVTDRDYVTNSFHVPVYFAITAAEKMQIEAPYHELCNAGSISYVEVDGDLTKNTAAVESLVQLADKLQMNYFSINHPVDRCPICGYVGVIGDECPKCGFKEDEGVSIEHLKTCGCNEVLKRLG